MLCGAVALPAPAVADVRWGETVTLAERDAGWGRMARLPDGRWLAVTTRFGDGHDTTLAISIGDVRARTWRPLSRVAEPGRKLDNGELLVLPDGRVLLAMRSLVERSSYRLDLYASDDGGRSWSFLSTIDRNESPGGRNDRGVWEPMLARLPDGALSVLYADETLADGAPPYNQVVSQRLSRDGGKTWGNKRAIVAEPGGGGLRPGMPVMARLQNGRYLLVFEICGADVHCPVSAKYSADGVHWPEGLGTPLAHQRCGPHVMSTRRGTTFVTSCDNQVTWSDDHGAHWQRTPQPAWPFGFRHSWPALYETGPDEIAVINNVAPGAVRIRFGTLEAGASAQPSD
ncbi:MAG TPA: hypothetical protein DDZ67_08160 [Xanthomonadaceae bacterium]|nr:hypothetical protein [Xanthomonadaceae bacterium]